MFFVIFEMVMVLMESRNLLVESMEYLKNADLTLEEILKEEPIHKLIDETARKRALRRAEERFAKWFTKRGKGFDDTVLRNVSYGFIRKAMLEELYSIILGYWGIAGGKTLDYTSLGYKISKRYHKAKGEALLKIVKGLIEMHSIRFGIEKPKLKVIALATVKLERWLEREYSDVVFRISKEGQVLGSY